MRERVHKNKGGTELYSKKHKMEWTVEELASSSVLNDSVEPIPT